MKSPFLLAAGLLAGAALILSGCAPAGDTGTSPSSGEEQPVTETTDPGSAPFGEQHAAITFEDGAVMYCVFWDPGLGQEGGEQLECELR